MSRSTGSPARWRGAPRCSSCSSRSRSTRAPSSWSTTAPSCGVPPSGPSRSLRPDVQGLLVAARTLVAEGFKVLAYTNEDLVTALRLEDAGCAAVMPLASPIGSGLGLLNPFGVRTIKRRLKVPVVVDAGVGTASDACLTMEQGVDGILMNTALAAARDPVAMARAMRLAVEAGRTAYLAGRMPQRGVAA